MAHIVSKYCTQLSQSQDLSLTHCPHSLKISYTLFTHLIAVTYCTSSLKISYSYTLFMQSHIWTHCSHSLKFSYTLLTLGHNISHILFTVSRYFSGCSVSTSQTQWHCSQYQNISHTLFTQSVSLNISHTVHAISRSFTIFSLKISFSPTLSFSISHTSQSKVILYTIKLLKSQHLLHCSKSMGLSYSIVHSLKTSHAFFTISRSFKVFNSSQSEDLSHSVQSQDFSHTANTIKYGCWFIFMVAQNLSSCSGNILCLRTISTWSKNSSEVDRCISKQCLCVWYMYTLMVRQKCKFWAYYAHTDTVSMLTLMSTSTGPWLPKLVHNLKKHLCLRVL